MLLFIKEKKRNIFDFSFVIPGHDRESSLSFHPFPYQQIPIYFSIMSRQSIKSLVSRFKNEVRVYRRVITHPRCPRLARICLGAAVVYALSPIDIIPDFIPVLGYLDDAIILPALVYVALRSLPDGLVDEVRAEMMSERNAQ